MKTWNQTIPFLRNDEQKVVANGYPDLRVNGVLGGSVEGLDVQVLLDPLEEQLNPGNIGRNIATLIGKNIAGVGTVF